MISQILLAEDDAKIREVIEDYFSEKGKGELCLTSAKNGSEALALFKENRNDLLMMDVMMPHIDAISL